VNPFVSRIAAMALALAATAAVAAKHLTEGEVRKVDKAAGKITLKHGEIKNLGMPPMTMVFAVKDPALLDNVQPGAKVRFAAEEVNGSYRVTAIEPAR
jgi:Cu(I)/Ag(I) efflux system protein CusF